MTSTFAGLMAAEHDWMLCKVLREDRDLSETCRKILSSEPRHFARPMHELESPYPIRGIRICS